MNKKTGQQNDYGFISVEGKADLFIHKRDVISAVSSLTEGSFVTFETQIDRRTNREHAKDVRLLSDTTDPRSIEECFLSSQQKFWPAIISILVAQGSPTELALIVSQRLSRLSQSEIVALISILPDQIFFSDHALRSLLPPARHFSIIFSMFEHEHLDEQRFDSEIVEILGTGTQFDVGVWERIPERVYRSNPVLRQHMPHDLHIRYLVSLLSNHLDDDRTESLLQEMDYRLCTLAFEQACIIVQNLPDSVRAHRFLLKYHPPIEQVEVAWPQFLTSSFASWHDLSREAKLFCLFRAAKETIALPVFEQLMDDDPVVKFAMVFLWAKSNPEKKSHAFQRAHSLFQTYIIETAWESTEVLDLRPLLPRCEPKVVLHCEGRPWPTEEESIGVHQLVVTRAFCPRKNRPCGLFPSSGLLESYDLEGARLYPDMSQNWCDWSLLELLRAADVTPNLGELRSPDEYVPKLAGWVNRLNEIRERLKCSVCTKIMKPNYSYAKNLARYNSTVVSCNQGIPHDNNIYLNHCWACRAIIDSREGTIQVDGYYLCLQCGSGPQESSTFKQGDVCPKCGGKQMTVKDLSGRMLSCSSCSHTIRLPAEQHRTGTNKQRKLN